MKQQQFMISPKTRVGHVSLNVFDIQRSLDFYQSILGFKLAGKPSSEKVLLSADGNLPHLIELFQIGAKEGDSKLDFRSGKISVAKRAGLYHFAILLPERKFLADMLVKLNEDRDQFYFEGLADHLVSESMYIRDPDFNGIEIYCDRPRSDWKWNGSYVQMSTETLNTENLLKVATKAGWNAMPQNTTIGHVHLHISSLLKAKFYSEVLGLILTSEFPGANFFAANRYHHHIAANTWLGTEIPVASPERVGLHHFGLELPGMQEFEQTIGHLSQKNVVVERTSSKQGSNSALLQDNDGIKIQLYYKK